ncbi:MAG: bifunctional diaminohydroxyphosphoribosylaminopyrimidine deaminase/5-amino-6-(5-phosphoribosylamino)uracil reductase RibD, partial [Gemmatimonadota bacterium]
GPARVVGRRGAEAVHLMGTADAAADRRWMARALELAEAGWGRVHPNPLVGAVVVREGRVVGEGAHREYGGPHAEVEALDSAGAAARGATLYVTLEPCAHHGKTPPCTTAVLDGGIARVVYAVADPHPAAGGGAARLREAGLEVTGGVLEDEARARNALFLRPLERERPFVAVKLAVTLDGRIARREGERSAVTGPETQEHVHRLRAGFDAVLIGGRTARVDDPSLTVRLGRAPRVPPIRVVADPMARLAPDGALVRTAEEVPVWVLVGPDAPADRSARLRERGVEVVATAAGPEGLDLRSALVTLMERGVRTVLCEGGGRLVDSLLDADRVDRLYLFIAPVVWGRGVPAFPGPAGFVGRPVEHRAVGVDTLITVDRSD